MTLAQAQRAFIAEIAADDDHAPSNLGMEIYRNAYRGRLVAALEVSFERTRSWVGEDAFSAAAAHYVLTCPPCSWTLDAYGACFPDELAALFLDDPEVAELAWLEWHMQQAFAAPDRPRLTPGALAAAEMGEPDWEHMRLLPAPGLTSRAVACDLSAIWHAPESAAPQPIAAAELLVWRQDLSPHFRIMESAEFAALAPLLNGASFGQVAVAQGEEGLAQFGQWFSAWLAEGLFSAVA